MVLGWRRAFCTSVPNDQQRDSPIAKEKSESNLSQSIGSRFGGFFSNPSTPRMQSQPVFSPTLRCRTTANAPPAAAVQANSAPQSPKLRCKTRIGPRFFNRSTPSSPRSPSTFSLLKSSLRLSKGRCEICLEGLKTGQGTAIFTAECRHSFHFPCISAQIRKQCSLTCPICKSTWKEIHLSPPTPPSPPTQTRGQDFEHKRDGKKSILKVYNDDEPLSSPISGARFNPIPESDEYEEHRNDEFPGFFAANNVALKEEKTQKVEFGLLSETAVVSVGKSSETHAVVLKIRSPAATAQHARRAPIDLVTVVNVGRSVNLEKIHLMKKAMRMVVSSLTAADRFSMVAFSSTSKRLLPLRRMTIAGKKAARRIIDAIIPLDDIATSAIDSLKKAAKVIEDRREKNPATAIMLFSDGHRGGSVMSHGLFSEIPLHYVNLNVSINDLPDETLAKCITNPLSIVIQDLRFQLGFTPDSAPGEVSAIYSSHGGRPTFLGSGSSWCKMGDLCSDEERDVLIELKVQSQFAGRATVAHRRLFVRCQYKDPSNEEVIHDKEGAILVPCPRAIGSSSSSTRESQRLRCLFVTTRALADSRRMADRNDIAGAQHMLASARALILQSGSGSESVRGLESELAELNWRRQDRVQQVQGRRNNNEREAEIEFKAEPLTPTSAWRAAERLAKLAIMKKSLNRVSDLHGFENARF